MTLAHEELHRPGRGPLPRPVNQRHGGRDVLAEVIPIRPKLTPQSNGILGLLITKARDFASPRAQAASVDSPPRPPSSPASRTFDHPSVPDGAA
jgi:hypothetical protein